MTVADAQPSVPLGVVVVTFGAHELLERNLGAMTLPCPAERIVIVDNFHSSGEREAIRAITAAHGWTYLPQERNRGFGAGVNVGARAALARGSEVLLILNPDASIEPTDLDRLRACAEGDPMSLVTPRILRSDGSVWFRGMTLDVRTGNVAAVPDKNQGGVDWVSGACLVVHRKLWEALGGFDEDYFLYWEDIDLSWRCTAGGGRLAVLNDATARHDVGGTQTAAAASGKSPTYYYYNCRNRLLFASKHLTPWEALRWVMTTPVAGKRILYRGGRRQLVRSVRPIASAVGGSLAGIRRVFIGSIFRAGQARPALSPTDPGRSTVVAASSASHSAAFGTATGRNRRGGGGASDLVVVFPTGRGLQRWRDWHAASPVPGVWPYGLEELGSTGREVEAVEATPLNRFERRALDLTGAVRLRPPHRKHAVALTWDEQTAVRMMARVGADRYYSGVIWATDLVASGGSSSDLAHQRRALLRADGLWCLSRPQVSAVTEWLGSAAPPVSFVTFGVDGEFYRPAPYPAAPRVVSVGGDRDRDPATLFAALEIVRTHRPDVECVVQSGSSLPAPAGVQKFDALPHDEVRRLYASGSVVAIATRTNWHASGMTVALEAMSVGRPVVACSTPGMEDYIDEGRTGHLVRPGDAESMAARVLDLLDDRDRAAVMGAAGRAQVESTFNTRAMCSRLLEVIG